MSNQVGESTKIPKNIRSIMFSGKKTLWTAIKFRSSFQPRDQNDVVNEEPTFKSDMLRHPDFDRAMDRLKVHLVIRYGFAEPVDRLGKPITKEYFDEHLFEIDGRFMDIEVTGLLCTTKKDQTNFQIIGKQKTIDGFSAPLKSPPISLLKNQEGEGYNYPLISLLDEHIDAIILEAKEFMKYKSANSQLRIAI